MAIQNRTKKVKHTSIPGVAKWPHLVKPDYKFKDAGEFHVKLRFGAEDFEACGIKELVDEAFDGAVKKAKAINAKDKKKPPKVLDKPYYLDEESNEYEISFKSKYSWVDKETKEVKTRRVPIFSASGAIIKNPDLKIGNETVMRVSFTIDPFFTAIGVGVSLKLEAVKILKLVEYGANAEAYGFGEDESDLYGEDESYIEDNGDDADGFGEDSDSEYNPADDEPF